MWDIDDPTLATVKLMAEGMPGGFFIYHASGDESFIYVNKALIKILGCSTFEEFKTITKNSFRTMVHPDDIDEVEKSISKQISENEDKLDYVEYRVIRKDGKIRWLVDYGHFMHTERFGDVFFVFVDDATSKIEKKRMEEERNNAIHANNAKSAFLFNMSHDLKTPLNAISGFAELARKNIEADGDRQKLSDYMEKIKISSDLLVDLLNDVLKMSEIESGNLSINEIPCNLEEHVELLAEIFRSQMSSKNLNFTVSFNVKHESVIADPLNLKRVLSNLLQNAVNFTGEKGSITLTVNEIEVKPKKPSVLPTRNNYQFIIKDTGCGMSRDFMKKMYKAFERGQNSTKSRIAGTGLGLTITKNLVEAMDGKIEAKSVKGKGSTFIVTIPFQKTEVPVQKLNETHHYDQKIISELKEIELNKDDTPSKNAERKKRVLLVEDIELNREITTEILTSTGIDVEVAVDGLESVEIFESKPEGYYDLILMDIQMPRMNGYDATRSIRAMMRKDAKSIPIFALTANTMDGDKKAAYESGMDDVIEKPMDIDSFLDLISSI